jgi:putative ABC transport system permease protein
MAIPLIYNIRSVRQRWTSSIVAVLGIAGTVGVFVAMLAMAKGFQATLVASGSPANAIIMRAGSTSEMYSAITLDQVKIIEEAPGVARGTDGPVVSPELAVIANFPLKDTGTDANVQVRGVAPDVLAVRDHVRLTAGRFFRPGLTELVVGRNVAATYAGFELGSTVRFGGESWTVVGVFDAGGSAFDSELWCDTKVLTRVYKRPDTIVQSVTVRLTSPAAFADLKDALSSDPRLDVTAAREIDYYEKESAALSSMITVLGSIIALIMGIGAVFGALNTMYSAVAERSREIATLRALGFGSLSVLASFIYESLIIAFVGGAIGCLAVLPVNGLTTGTMNWQTFSHLAFAFHITPPLLLAGMLFALLMGLAGGLPPALRAVRLPVATALREL